MQRRKAMWVLPQKRKASAVGWLGATLFLAGCASHPEPLPRAQQVDLERFMGAWYVIGYTPTFLDKNAHNGVEHYYLKKSASGGKDKILTTYQFRKGSFDGELKTLKPTGFVYDKDTNAEWRMQFFWPFKADYIVMYLSEDYQQTVIAHPNRRYAWIMQRTPEMPEDTYNQLLNKLEVAGYDPAIIKRQPQNWQNDQQRLADIERIGASEPLVER
ncbi:lipocalin family protein [Porticoccus sp. W117]|uniref:lipocalin family protein n=1 Tax=Porticoccus sp. W117 TaxID=3054777 RepID=UPI0025938AEC|nr:lipocalin family protein [Porticoccus sp. W117]MDM3870018.1 lipocalin family protein [Porticoccus sp. W117]